MTNYAQPLGGGLSASRSAGASAFVFAVFLAAGTLYIVVSKSLGVSAFWATMVPLLIILAYAIVLGFARYLRLRDDQAGDNLYYLGFLYTLTSLGVSLWQFSASGGADAVVTNFGIAVSSTILGVALRVFFGQMRQDPLEVERSARLDLAEAARRVRQELDATVFEFSSFRRATQQSLSEGVVEVKKHVEGVSAAVSEALKELPERSAAPLESASREIGQVLEKLTATLRTSLEQTAAKLEKEASQLATVAADTAEALKGVEAQLKGMQMPEGIIEIKLQPTIRSMTKALKELSERQGEQIDQLQSAIAAATAATETISHASEAGQAAQNQALERITALLSSNEELYRRLLESLSTAQERQREERVELLAILRRHGERQSEPAPIRGEPARRAPDLESTPSDPRSRWWFRR